ncbi:MAG: MATE family efflux transporter [Alphaproteobacteria bacterium]|nr:MATE family efflux transporter [Alphaproteobacteria bacterium]MBU1559860.1 MATE family efflux transporter [Alphaproteobacteria bacterium]MBU2300987.1 MATE family efflux transporter [Alphaproteobacteria bacterium]MBU2369538.1 MATE family efflux transporter [Alphaproteobacteria bacterium]
MSEQVTVAPGAAVNSAPARGGWGAELRATFALAWPLVIAQLAQNALTATDVIMLGWLGPSHLAAGTLATTFIMPFFVGGIGIVGAVAPLVAQARGARDIRAVRRIVRQGMWAAILLATLMVPVLLQIRPIFAVLGQNPDTAIMSEQYIQVGVWMLFPALAMVALRSLLSAFDATRIILLITIGGVIVNALANYALMFGNFGMPRLELRGAALATVLSNILMFGLMLAHVLRHRRFKRFYVLMRFWKPDWVRFREIFRIGTPIGLTVLAEVGLFTAAALLMGLLGTDEVAAHAVALQCASMAFMVPLGLGIAATVRVGMAYGRSDPEGIRKAGWTAFVLGTGFMAFSCVLFLTAGPTIVTWFLDPRLPENANALALAATFLVVAGVFQLVDGAQVVAAHALRGLSDTKIPMVLAILGYWAVGLPIAYILGFVVGWRGVGIWIGLAAGLAFVAVVLVIRFAMRERLGLLRPR